MENEFLKSSMDDAFHTLLDAINESAFLIDLNANFLAVNDTLAKRLGKSKEELLGKCAYDFLPKHLADIRKKALIDLLETKKSVIFWDEHSGMVLENRMNPVFNDKKEVHQVAIFSKDVTQAKIKENKLKESEENLTHFINTSPASIYFIRFTKPLPLSLNFLETIEWMKQYEYVENCNNAAAKNWGYQNKSELIGRSTYDILGQNEDLLKTIVRPHYENDWFFENEETHEINNNGEKVFFLNSSIPIIKDKHVYGLNVISINISKTKALEKKLKESEESLSKFINTSPSSIYSIRLKKALPLSLNFDETIEWVKKYDYLENCNDVTAQNWGYKSKHEIIGKSTFDVVGKNEEVLRSILKPHYDNKWEHQNEETHEIINNGESAFFLNSSFPLIKDNHVYGLNVISINITQIKRLKKKLKETNERLEQTLSGTNSGTFMHDFKAQNIYLDKTACQILGLKKTEIALEDWINIIHPSYKKDISSKLKQGLEKFENKISLDYKIILPNFAIKHVSVRSEVKYNETGPDKSFGLIQDITLEKEKEDELVKTKTELENTVIAKDKFISILSHDLRSPFQSLLGFSDLVYKNVKNKDFEGIEKMAFLLNKTSKNTFELLESLLMWGNAKRGVIDFKPNNYRLNEIVQQVYELVRTSAITKKININLALEGETKVFGDRDMIKTVIRNLLSNAIKFSFEGGEINIYTKTEHNKAKLIITDNGMGMEAKKLEQLFMIEHTRSTKGSKGETGSGLGLLICKEFIDINKGHIDVESQVGRGTTFTVELPIPSSQLHP